MKTKLMILAAAMGILMARTATAAEADPTKHYSTDKRWTFELQDSWNEVEVDQEGIRQFTKERDGMVVGVSQCHQIDADGAGLTETVDSYVEQIKEQGWRVTERGDSKVGETKALRMKLSGYNDAGVKVIVEERWVLRNGTITVFRFFAMDGYQETLKGDSEGFFKSIELK